MPLLRETSRLSHEVTAYIASVPLLVKEVGNPSQAGVHTVRFISSGH